MQKKTGNTFYHLIWNIASSYVLSKKIKANINRTIILPAVWYGCQTWSLILREEHRLRLCGNRVLRKLCGHEKEEVKRDWRKQRKGQLHDLYCSQNIIRVRKPGVRGAGQVARMGERRSA
jgi:hypothetical protein